jgi:hypothetical protein
VFCSSANIPRPSWTPNAKVALRIPPPEMAKPTCGRCNKTNPPFCRTVFSGSSRCSRSQLWRDAVCRRSPIAVSALASKVASLALFGSALLDDAAGRGTLRVQVGELYFGVAGC